MTPLTRIERDIYQLRSWAADRLLGLSRRIRPVSREIYFSPGFVSAMEKVEEFLDDQHRDSLLSERGAFGRVVRFRDDVSGEDLTAFIVDGDEVSP